MWKRWCGIEKCKMCEEGKKERRTSSLFIGTVNMDLALVVAREIKSAPRHSRCLHKSCGWWYLPILAYVLLRHIFPMFVSRAAE